MPAGDRIYIWLWNAGHMGWADYSESSKLVQVSGPLMTPEGEDVQRISSAMSVVFLDAHLRGDATARARLNQDYARSLTGKVVRRLDWSEK